MGVGAADRRNERCRGKPASKREENVGLHFVFLFYLFCFIQGLSAWNGVTIMQGGSQ